MSKERKRRKSSNAATPSTPKSKYHVDDNMLATPKTHYIQDEDSDSSPYSLSFSQRATGVEVIWGEKSRPTPFKSRKNYERRDTESPPTKNYVDVEPVVASESPKGLFKFLLGLERRRIANSIEEDFESIIDEQKSNGTNATTSFGTNHSTATEQAGSNVSNSPNYKQLLNDSEDMNLMLCSQRIEQEVFSRSEPVVEQGYASKGFSEFFFSDNDDDLLLALDDPVLLDKKLPQKSSFARHKSIAIQPNSSIAMPSNSNSGNSAVNFEPKPGTSIPPVKPSTPTTATATSVVAPMLVRHKSMPSPILTKCSAEEIEIKRRNALERLKARKEKYTKK